MWKRLACWGFGIVQHGIDLCQALVMSVGVPLALVDGDLALWGAWNDLWEFLMGQECEFRVVLRRGEQGGWMGSYQVVKDALVQWSFISSALP